MTASSHFGACCVCGRAGATIMYCLPYEAPEGFHGWGCVVCDLPPRGAVAMLCQSCALCPTIEPKLVCAGEYPIDGERMPIEQLEKTPFDHNPARHAEEALKLEALEQMRADQLGVVLSHGEGKYDDLCTYVREQADAAAAFVIVIAGNKGSGFSVQSKLPVETLLRLPDLLEDLAKRVRADVGRLKN